MTHKQEETGVIYGNADRINIYSNDPKILPREHPDFIV